MGSSGSGSQGSSQYQSPPIIPSWLKPYYKNTAKGLESAQGQLPSISELYGTVPLLNIPNLSPEEQQLIGGFENQTLQPAGNQYSLLSGQGYGSFIGQNGQPSAATQAAEKQFADLQAPEILQQSALMGSGQSGAALQALAQGQESAIVPFLTADEQNQLAASQGLQGLGAQEFSQTQEALTNALEAAGLPTEVARQQAQALFNQQQQRFQIATGVQTGGQGQFPSLIGGGSGTSNIQTSAPKF